MYCQDWRTWTQAVNSDPNPYDQEASFLAYFFNYSMYIILCILYASLSAYFVYTFARMAFSSGLPEIKTVLGGFIIKGLLGKSI